VKTPLPKPSSSTRNVSPENCAGRSTASPSP
jgi:hypothetical protein